MYGGLLALTQSAISPAFFNTHLQVTSKNDKRTLHVGHAMGIVFSHPDLHTYSPEAYLSGRTGSESNPDSWPPLEMAFRET